MLRGKATVKPFGFVLKSNLKCSPPTSCTVALSLSLAVFFTHSIFLAGISYQIRCTNSVSRFTIHSYNVVATTMWPLEIATLVSRVKVASDTEAYCGNKDVGSVRRQAWV